MFRKIACINKKHQDLSTTFVLEETDQGTRKITDKDEMEKVIINANKDKYHQTEDSCPFMKEPLCSDFGYLGIGPKQRK